VLAAPDSGTPGGSTFHQLYSVHFRSNEVFTELLKNRREALQSGRVLTWQAPPRSEELPAERATHLGSPGVEHACYNTAVPTGPGRNAMNAAGELLGRLDGIPVSQGLRRAFLIAKGAKRPELERWCRLELEGYLDTNATLGEDIVVPKYRTVQPTLRHRRQCSTAS